MADTRRFLVYMRASNLYAVETKSSQAAWVQHYLPKSDWTIVHAYDKAEALAIAMPRFMR